MPSPLQTDPGRPAFTVRAASPADIEIIRALADTIWREVYPGIIPEDQIDYMLAWMYSGEKIREEMERQDIHYFLLLVDGEPVGFAAYGPEKASGAAKLHKIYLLPRFHGRGLGSALLEFVHAHAAAAGFPKIVLQVNKQNRPAIRTYQKNGYTIHKEAVFDIGRGYVMDDYVMGRELKENPSS